QKPWKEDDLLDILNIAIKDAEVGKVKNEAYLAIFGLKKEAEIQEIWQVIFQKIKNNISEKHAQTIEFLLKEGSLSTRIIKALNKNYSDEKIKSVYLKIADCLSKNQLFTI
ncbi:MAG TPA: glutamate--cysteine ligase, partial [Zunongwangia profunda]|nr:glutamate--cysteine ligase [Zunongwangia profunda]